MNALRVEADSSAAQVEELKAKVKSLEQENLQKEQEITSLQHKNGVLEAEVEKLEKLHSDAKAAADESAQHGTQNEGLTRKVQLLEEEAEENEKQLRETNEKLVDFQARKEDDMLIRYPTDSGRQTSKPATTSAKSRPSKPHVTNGRPSTRRWRRSTPIRRRSSTTLWPKSVISKPSRLQQYNNIILLRSQVLLHGLANTGRRALKRPTRLQARSARPRERRLWWVKLLIHRGCSDWQSDTGKEIPLRVWQLQ